jgi:diacylglycerol O-acyltransferase / wax synthase
VAIMSYNGGIDFGLLGDYDAMPDLDSFAEMLLESRDELVAVARGRSPNGRARTPSSRGRTSRPRTSSPASKGA